MYKKFDHQRVAVAAYTNADWVGSLTDCRSTSGYCSFVWGNPVTWRSKRQSMVARSSVEAQFRFMANGICELLQLRKLLDELGYQVMGPMNLFCDNKVAISIAHDPVQHDRTKHVDID